MGYHKNTNQIWKIWDLIDKKVREITSNIFNKTFSIKLNKKLLNFFANLD